MTPSVFRTVWEVPRSMRAAVQSSFYLSSDALNAASPWTQESSPYGPLVQYHIAEINPPTLRSTPGFDGEVTWRDWQGFITRLRGTSGLLRIVDYFRMRPRFDLLNAGASALWSDGDLWSDGKPWVIGALPPFVTLAENAKAGDDSIVMQGLPPNTPDVLNPSDLTELRPGGIATPYGNLYECIHSGRANANGKTRVYIQPGLRQDFNAGDMCVLRYPTSVFRLADKTQGIVTRTAPGGHGSLGFKLIEKMPNG